MENMNNYALSTCILICVIAGNFLFAYGIIWTKYSFDSKFTGLRCVPNETIFEVENVMDPVTCGKMCHVNDKCSSFAYQPDSHKCVGCRVDLFGPLPTNVYEELPGSVYFRNKGNCTDILEKNRTATSGVYEIKLWHSRKKLKVYCDMETDGGGWTVIQNRFDGSVDFYRKFADYENGFGDVRGEFWLGLKYIQEIAQNGPTGLRLEVSNTDGDQGSERFHEFELRSGKEYKLYFDEMNIQLTGMTARVAFSGQFGQPFSTRDKDMDNSEDNCAVESHGAWWYADCGNANLNGNYCTPGELCDDGKNGRTGLYHLGFAAGYESLKTSRLMIRRE